MGQNEKTNRNWAWFILLAVIVIIGLIWFALATNQGENRRTHPKVSLLTELSEQNTTKDQVTLLIQQSTTKDAEVARLQNEVNSLNAIICDLKNQLAEKPKTSSQKPQQVSIKITTESASTPSSAPTVTASSYSKVVPVVAKAVQEDYPAVSADLSDLFEGGKISFCVMANGNSGLHFPQLALDRGVQFSSIETNPSDDGHNWIVNPINRMEGDRGLVVDGTFFVSDAMMTKVLSKDGTQLSSVMIKTPFTKWQPKPMTLENGYWVFHTR